MHKLIVANWKMYLSHQESLTWLESNLKQLEAAAQEASNKLIICPSYTVLPFCSGLFGAQDCSFEEKGAYTGDISVVSLKELGCSYVIVGHSERRNYHKETTERVGLKIGLLLKYGIEPIMCIGETARERKTKDIHEVLRLQMLPLLAFKNTRFIIAYEPVWAIGTGKIPRTRELYELGNWIKDYLHYHVGMEPTVLYGGSVDATNAKELVSEAIDGFLVGKSSTDPEILKSLIAME